MNKSTFHPVKFCAVSATRAGHSALFRTSFVPAVARAAALLECCLSLFDFAWTILAAFVANFCCVDICAVVDPSTNSEQTLSKCSSASTVFSASWKASCIYCNSVLSDGRCLTTALPKLDNERVSSEYAVFSASVNPVPFTIPTSNSTNSAELIARSRSGLDLLLQCYHECVRPH